MFMKNTYYLSNKIKQLNIYYEISYYLYYVYHSKNVNFSITHLSPRGGIYISKDWRHPESNRSITNLSIINYLRAYFLISFHHTFLGVKQFNVLITLIGQKV